MVRQIYKQITHGRTHRKTPYLSYCPLMTNFTNFYSWLPIISWKTMIDREKPLIARQDENKSNMFETI